MVLNKTRKRKISDQLFGYSRERIKLDYEQLRQVTCKNITKYSPLSILGTKFIDHYTGMERLNTIGNKGINFYEFWEKRNKYKKEKYVQNMLEYYKNYPNIPEIKRWKYIFNLYFSAITLFRPITAMEVYCKYSPRTVLDFTMGWGGRLLAAAALDIPTYIGIDINTNLRAPYTKMVRDLDGLTETKFDLYFQDALTIDYSKLRYDMVFTSPPYYNIEIYPGTVRKEKQEWNETFYTPLFSITWKYLQRGGYYCLNVPVDVYQAVCLPLFGRAKSRISMKKTKRTDNEKYKEYTYVWKKGG
jgi:hypothetical protein